MNILRMIKLFAWEPFVLKQISERREEELRKIRNVRFLEVTMDSVIALLPLISKLSTLAAYVSI